LAVASGGKIKVWILGNGNSLPNEKGKKGQEQPTRRECSRSESRRANCPIQARSDASAWGR
jgi:hypothetical protein